MDIYKEIEKSEKELVDMVLVIKLKVKWKERKT